MVTGMHLEESQSKLVFMSTISQISHVHQQQKTLLLVLIDDSVHIEAAIT